MLLKNKKEIQEGESYFFFNLKLVTVLRATKLVYSKREGNRLQLFMGFVVA